MDKGGAKAERGYPGPTRGGRPCTNCSLYRRAYDMMCTITMHNSTELVK